MSDIGWNFPLLNGAGSEGWNSLGMDYFKGSRHYSVAREIIQNSLDAAIDDRPVSVVFEVKNIDFGLIGGAELREAMRACLVEADDTFAQKELEDAIAILEGSQIPCLVVSDSNTTGLGGDQWKALVKDVGKSRKTSEDSGGSFGYGKHAPFVLSPLRSVFYWSAFEDGDQLAEKLQGKTILMSHGDGDDEKRGTGFWGIKDHCQAIGSLDDINDIFRRRDASGDPLKGTSVIILGFSQEGSWRAEIATSVLSSFFYAIDEGKLEVTIEPDGDEEDCMYLKDIKADTLDEWFEYLLEQQADDSNLDEATPLQLAKELRNTYESSEGGEVLELDDEDFGKVVMHINVREGLDKKVGIIRSSGMLITAEQKGLKQFTSCQDFLALVLVCDKPGSEFLKTLENPEHNQFSIERLPADFRTEADRKLKELIKAIRNKLKEVAAKPEVVISEDMDILAELLPDSEPEEDFDIDEDKKWREHGLGSGITGKRRKSPRPLKPPTTNSKATIQVSNLRILPSGEEESLYKVIFTARSSDTARPSLHEMGDAIGSEISDVEWLNDAKQPVDTIKTSVGRHTLYARTSATLTDMSCLLTLKIPKA